MVGDSEVSLASRNGFFVTFGEGLRSFMRV
jgi:hypothetical protein